MLQAPESVQTAYCHLEKLDFVKMIIRTNIKHYVSSPLGQLPSTAGLKDLSPNPTPSASPESRRAGPGRVGPLSPEVRFPLCSSLEDVWLLPHHGYEFLYSQSKQEVEKEEEEGGGEGRGLMVFSR